uniref:Integrase catalytic domain-containing protein n=1 Tax=Peronospora matthiolae TaxID=2874970 RepID=A0AAV1T532_9STRA
MSPNGDTDAAGATGAQPRALTGRERASSLQGENLEVKAEAVPGNTEQRMLDLLTGLAERMAKLEASQGTKDQPMDKESSVFGSAIGLGQPMNRRALNVTPPRAPSPHMSPGTYFGMNQPGYARAAENVERAQAPQPGLPQHFVPPTVCQQAQIPQHVPSYARVPDARQRKLNIRHFDGKELYQGLGSGFLSWGKKFVREVSFAERASGFPWSEDVKIDVLGHNLTGMAERYYNRQVEGWWQEKPTLEHAMQRLLHTFATKITPAQSMKLFTAAKSPKRSWTEHYLYLVAVSEACGGADNLVQDNIVHYADPAMRVSMLARLNLTRFDYLRQAEELAHFAQSTEIELRGKHIGKDVVNNVRHVREKTRNGRKDNRKCYSCGKSGHIKAAYPGNKVSRETSVDVDFVLAVGNPSANHGYWILDSGSSRHLVNDVSMLENPEDCQSECIAADGGPLRITKRGSVTITTTVMGKVTKVRLLDVQYAENLERNIISYGILEAKGFGIAYMGDRRVVGNIDSGVVVFDVGKKNNVLIVRDHDRGSVQLPSDILMTALAQGEFEVSQDVQRGTLMHFHRRLAHLNYDTILRMAKDPASGIQLTDETRENCLACAQGKQTKNQQSRKDTGTNAPIDVIGGVICSDLKGPMTPRDRLGNRYMVNFVDHRTNYCRVFLAKSKDVAAQKFKHFMAFFERQFNCRIHVLRTDGGGEYRTLDLFCKETGIARQISEPSNQASNGKAERMHHTIMNMVRSMVFACGLPLSFWGDAAEYAAYILNRSPSKANAGRLSPLQMLTKKVPVLSDIVVFGSPCTVHQDAKNKSLGDRGKQGVIIGKSDEVKGYRVYIPRDKVVVVTQYVKNVETLTKEQNDQLRRVHLKEIDEVACDGSTQKEKTQATVHDAMRRNHSKVGGWTREAHVTRATSRKSREDNAEQKEEEVSDVVNVIRESDPKSYGQAMKSGLKDKWVAAMDEELRALEDNDVWKVEVRPKGSHVLHTKWVFKTKLNAEGEIDRFKARLVACGNEQVYGVDYGLTFAAVMELSTVKVILVLALRWGVPARHGDIPNAYVKANKEEHLEIFLVIPQGMTVPDVILKQFGTQGSDKLALRLKKPLYGLKQAGRLWSKLLDTKLVEAGFSRCVSDACLYIRHDGGELTIVGVYVDDLLVTATSQDKVEEFFKAMSVLSIKDLGQVNKFLGMRMALKDSKTYTVDQTTAIDEMLNQHGLNAANGVRAPIGDDSNDDVSEGVYLSANRGKKGEPTVRNFQSLVGSLLWIARCSRPDISFAVHRATRRTHQPTVSDWKLAKRVARYLKTTKDMKLKMSLEDEKDVITVTCWSDSDFAADKSDRKSITGGVLTVSGVIVHWICKKQTGVSLSTMEAEFTSASHVGRELLGLRELLKEIGLPVTEPMSMLMDNQAAIKMLESEGSMASAKHVDVRMKFICDYAKKGIVKPEFVESKLMKADLLTKTLPAPRVAELRELFNLV